ncbi:MAG: hypothetical protein VB878_16605 [Pirellulaceae bacterium]
MKHTACMVWLGMAGVLCLPHVLSAQELAAVNVPILRIDVSYLMLDTKHELVGKLDEANLATDLLKKQRVLVRSGTATPAVEAFALSPSRMRVKSLRTRR